MCTLHFFFFNDTATTEIYTLSLHDALPIYWPEVTTLPSTSFSFQAGAGAGATGSARTGATGARERPRAAAASGSVGLLVEWAAAGAAGMPAQKARDRGSCVAGFREVQP